MLVVGYNKHYFWMSLCVFLAWYGIFAEETTTVKLEKRPQLLTIPKLIIRTSDFRYEELDEKFLNILKDTVDVSKNPGYNQVFFHSSDREHFIKLFYPSFLPYYKNVIPEQYKADFFRFLAVYRYGGISSEMQVTFMESISDMFASDDGFAASADLDPVDFWGGWFAAYARHPLIRLIAIMISDNLKYERYNCNHLDITGPRTIGRAFRFFRGQYSDDTKVDTGSNNYGDFKMKILKFTGEVVQDQTGKNLMKSSFDGYDNIMKTKGPVYGNMYFDHKTYKSDLRESPVYNPEGNMVAKGNSYWYVHNGERRGFPNWDAMMGLGLRPCMVNRHRNEATNVDAIRMGAMFSENTTANMVEVDLFGKGEASEAKLEQFPWSPSIIANINNMNTANLTAPGEHVVRYSRFLDFVEYSHSILHEQSTDSYYLLYAFGTLRSIPDFKTAQHLGLRIEEIDTISEHHYSLGHPIESFAIIEGDGESTARALFDKAAVLCPSHKVFIGASFSKLSPPNPAVIHLRNKALVSYITREGLHVGLALKHIHELSIDKALGVTPLGIKPESIQQLVAMPVNHHSYMFALILNTNVTGDEKDATEISKQKPWQTRYKYGIIEYNDTSSNAVLSNSVRSPLFDTDKEPTSWVPFAHSGRAFFITSVHPLEMSELVELKTRSIVKKIIGEETTASSSDSSSSSIHSKHSNWIPWQGSDFGRLLHASTSPILVHGSTYLALFHTEVALARRTAYYMGAYTLCRQDPSKLHSMSKYPIVNDRRFYTYDQRPTSMWLDETHTHLSITMSTRQNSTVMLKLSLNGLLESLSLVSTC